MTDPASGPPPLPVPLDEAADLLAGLYAALFAPDQVVELRALDVRHGRGRPHVEAGFFDAAHFRDLAVAALAVSPHAKGVYATLNPVNPDLLARRANRLAWANEGELAKDKDVLARRWLLVDADPVRDPLVSATDAEKAEARAVILDVRDHLGGHGWPTPVLADSGNGYHLLYRVDGPADDGGAVRRLLAALGDRFDTPRVKIDRTVYNPSRICKLPGTLARTGDHTPGRPHRRAIVLEGPTP